MPRRCPGFSLQWLLLLRSTHSRARGLSSRALQRCPVAVALRFSNPEALGIFPDQRSNLGPLHWQADSYPLHHQLSPTRWPLWCMNHTSVRSHQASVPS